MQRRHRILAACCSRLQSRLQFEAAAAAGCRRLHPWLRSRSCSRGSRSLRAGCRWLEIGCCSRFQMPTVNQARSLSCSQTAAAGFELEPRFQPAAAAASNRCCGCSRLQPRLRTEPTAAAGCSRQQPRLRTGAAARSRLQPRLRIWSSSRCCNRLQPRLRAGCSQSAAGCSSGLESGDAALKPRASVASSWLKPAAAASSILSRGCSRLQ